MGRVKQKTIFLTGANGFIGKNIREQLGGKYFFLSPTHKQLDLLDQQKVDKYFQRNKIDIVIHCAVLGGSRESEQETNAFVQNMRIFFHIIKNKHLFGRMIQIGSGAEYNKEYPLVKVKESNFGMSVPTDEYSLYKYACSKYIENNNNIVNLRVFGLYGKYEDYRYRFISHSICRYIFDLPITMNQNVFFEYVYINDFVRIIRHFIDNDPKQKFYNIGRNSPIDLITIAKKINALGTKKQKLKIKKSGLNNEYTCNSNLLLKDLKKFSFTDFDTSLRELYCWYKNCKNSIKVSAIK